MFIFRNYSGFKTGQRFDKNFICDSMAFNNFQLIYQLESDQMNLIQFHHKTAFSFLVD